MSSVVSFPEMLDQIRAGDQAAAAELVRLYEPEIKKAIRLPMHRMRLHLVLDATDICQSVLAAFFTRAALGWFDEIQRPEQLARLLVTMARNKVRDEARRQRASRRDRRCLERVPDSRLEAILDHSPSPSKIVAGHELIREIYNHLTSEERYLAEQRALGRPWAALASESHASPDSLRKKLTRAIDRVSRQLGLDMPLPMCAAPCASSSGAGLPRRR